MQCLGVESTTVIHGPASGTMAPNDTRNVDEIVDELFPDRNRETFSDVGCSLPSIQGGGLNAPPHSGCVRRARRDFNFCIAAVSSVGRTVAGVARCSLALSRDVAVCLGGGVADALGGRGAPPPPFKGS